MKELCKLHRRYFKKIVTITNKPKFVCTKRTRAANEKKYLCDPEKMED